MTHKHPINIEAKEKLRETFRHKMFVIAENHQQDNMPVDKVLINKHYIEAETKVVEFINITVENAVREAKQELRDRFLIDASASYDVHASGDVVVLTKRTSPDTTDHNHETN